MPTEISISNAFLGQENASDWQSGEVTYGVYMQILMWLHSKAAKEVELHLELKATPHSDLPSKTSAPQYENSEEQQDGDMELPQPESNATPCLTYAMEEACRFSPHQHHGNPMARDSGSSSASDAMWGHVQQEPYPFSPAHAYYHKTAPVVLDKVQALVNKLINS